MEVRLPGEDGGQESLVHSLQGLCFTGIAFSWAPLRAWLQG